MQIKPLGKIIILLLAIGLGVGAVRLWNRFAPAPTGTESVVPKQAELPPIEGGATTSIVATDVTMPSQEPITTGETIRFLGYAWNAQMGLLFANGGAETTRGSLMHKRGVHLLFTRQDDNNKLQEALVTFAQELANGKAQPQNGAHFVAVMGDGSAVFLKGLNDTLSRLGSDYRAVVVGSCGYSRGEDKFMGPAEWKQNPQASRGGVVAGVIRDGDWNIAQKWLGDNGLRTNPDEKTYDPDALNWINASDYIDAAEKYVSGYSEDRPVVRNGRRTGETKRLTVQAIVTWTPGDVTAAKKKGGIVSIVSTREYSSQMPNVIIGISKWCKQNKSTVENMLEAIAEGGNAVKTNAKALRRAAEISADVYHESGADADYWERYYKGVQEPDMTGHPVELGGSSANNLADMLLTFGLVPGSSNVFAATYRVFGDIVKSQYPDLLPNYYPVEQILDTAYLTAVARRKGSQQVASAVETAKPHFEKSGPVKTVVSRKSWNIQFKPNSATLTGDAEGQLRRLLNDTIVASGTVVEIHGHTDNAGNPATSKPLSQSRAATVKRWLETKYPVNFPANRIRVFAHGEDNPIASNATAEGRAKNRRVDIVLGTTR